MTTLIQPGLPGLLDVLERAHIGIMVLGYRDGAYVKLYANGAALGRLGYGLDEWLAKPMFDMIADDRKAAMRQLYDRLRSHEPLPPSVEVELIHRDGHRVRTEITAAHAEIDGEPAVVLLVRDMDNPQQSNMSLLEADRISLVGALSAGFAHETNNPLTSVLLNLRSLRKLLLLNLVEAKQSAALRILDDITTGAERIASNVRAFQTLASRGSVQTLDLAAVASAVLRLAMPTLEPRAHVIRQIFSVPPVAGEESRIGQAILAMLLFAVSGFDASVTDANNRIIVTVEDRDGWPVVEVSDNGRELAPDDQTRVFDPFFRAPERGAGFGVGLGVARTVATTLGGEVALSQRTGGGMVLTMRLPPAPKPKT